MKKINFIRLLVLMLVLMTSINSAWADLTLRYQKNMPGGNYDGNTSATMTQSSAYTNRYYCEISLEQGGSDSYGFFIINGSDYYKPDNSNITIQSNYKAALVNKGSSNYGGCSHRVVYTLASAGTYIFTYDTGTKEIFVSPKSNETIKISYATANDPNDNRYDLGNYTDLSQVGNSANYCVDLSLSATKYYMFMQLREDNSDTYVYWKGTSPLSENGYVPLWAYGTSNYGNSPDKVNFTPSAAGKYRFTWNHDDKTVSYQRVYTVTYNGNGNSSGSAPSATNYPSGATVTVAGSGTMSKTGYYSFDGWNRNNDGSGTNYTGGSGTFTKASSDETLYARWEQNITLDKGDGTANGEATIYWNATGLKSKTNPTKAGWTVEGYYAENTLTTKILDGNGNFVGDVSGYVSSGKWCFAPGSTPTLYTKWKQTYSVTYYSNGSTSGAAPTDANEYSANAEVTVLGAGTLAKTYYDFIGWNTSAGQSTATYTTGSTFNITGNTALYPVWAKHEYTVTISGGTESSTTTVYDEYNGTATVSIPLNKHFTGWELGTGVTLKGGYSTTDETIVFKATQDATVTAQFSDIHVYIEGRFSCRSTSEGAFDKYVGSSEGDWSTTSKNVELIWNGSTNKYELQTYCTAAELSAQRNSNDTYIRINTCIGSADLSSGDVMGPVGDGHITRDGIAVSSSYDKSLYFRSGSATGATNVVITYDPRTNKVAFSATETLYSVTISDNGKGSTSITGTKTNIGSVKVPIKAIPSMPYYKFEKWVASANVSVENATSDSTTFTATGNGTLQAIFSSDGIILLDKTAISGKWGGTPYVYFYSAAYWNASAGAGSKKTSKDGVPSTCISGPHAMTRIGDSQIWYYDYSSLLSAGTSKQYVAFTDASQDGYDWFDACSVIYRGDFYPKSPMFVVKDYMDYYNKHDNKQACYYEGGYWRKYNDTDPGYVIKTYNGFAQGSSLTGTYHLSSDEPGASNCTVDIPLNSGTNYFKVVGCDTTTINSVAYAGTYYRDGSNGTMNTDNCTNWLLTDGNGSNTGVLATASSNYKFTLSLGAGSLYISVDFPLAVGDFRLMYNGKMRTTYNSKKKHPSNFIRKLKQPTIADDTTRVDTISFFIDPASGDLVPSLSFQHCSNIDGYTIYWRDTLSAIDLSSITKAGTYNFIVTQTNNKSGTHTISCVLDKAYSGNYYIRTNSATGGWKSYKVSADNMMTFSDYAKKYSGYDYYFCKWVNTDANVKFTIANDYSECITDTVDNDDIVNRDDPNNGKLQYQASVRFMYNSATNDISRAYLNGSSEGIADYLYIMTKDGTSEEIGAKNDSIKNADGSAITSVDGYKTVKFEDNNNWVYVKNIQAREGTHVRLISDYYDNSSHHYQYLKGCNAGTWTPASTSQIIGGTSGEFQTLRMVYDFKTNQLLAAWMPSGSEINAVLPIYADVMIIREAQGDAKQITFGLIGDSEEYGSLTDVKTVYGVMQFNKYTLNNKSKTGGHADLSPALSTYERDLYWISFPFDVNLNDVFGFGTYGTHWIIEYYDGKGRAKNGFWADSPSNWKFVYPYMRDTFKLKANEGYILALDLDEMNLGTNTGVWANNVTDIYLYFPSSASVGSITQTDATLNIDQKGYQCTIGPRFDGGDDRTIKDSYWHCIGVPSFANTTHGTNTGWTTGAGADAGAVDAGDYPNRSNWTSKDLPYLYEWVSSDNTLRPVNSGSATFKAMYSYLVQYNKDTIKWMQVTTPTAAAVAARIAETPDREYKLVLRSEERTEDQTYVRLTDDEGISQAFEFNYDLSKEYNAGRGNIWTVTADTVEVAGNSMPKPLQTTVVPVGVKVVANGEYTLAMPEGTNGEDVFLIDNAYGTRTNLGLMPYTVTLTAGTYDSRFALEFAPIQDSPTSLENDANANANANADVRKVFVGGRLYIIRDGKVYDAAGQRIE